MLPGFDKWWKMVIFGKVMKNGENGENVDVKMKKKFRYWLFLISKELKNKLSL